MTKDKRLGRGLAALLNGADDEDVASPDATSTGPQLYRTAPSDLDASQREADADGGGGQSQRRDVHASVLQNS